MLISIIIPTYNRPDLLARAIQSVAGQTYNDIEIIVVDDASDRDNGAIIASSSVSIIYHRFDTNMGANICRNKGIKFSGGEYIAFLDDDDEFVPQKIEKVVNAIKRSPDTDIFYHPAKIHMVNEKVYYITKPMRFKDDDDIFRKMLIKNIIGGTPMVVAKKSALEDVGMFDEHLPALQDYDLWIRLAKAGKRFTFIDARLTNCHYYTKKFSVSKSLYRNKKSLTLIENKFADDYAMLSRAELRKHEFWKIKMVVHKALLNYEVNVALKNQFFLVLKMPSIFNIASLLAICLGPKAVFKLKGMLSR